MIPKRLPEVSMADLQALIENGVREGKTIEYKRDLPRAADSDTVPFLAAVSAFANTSGGDLLIGAEEDGGLAKAFPGVEVSNIDAEKLRLGHILASGLEPRLPRMELHPLKVADGRYVIVVRVPRSWVAPHRVKKNDKFYGRSSVGKYPLDVGELRVAFTLSESVAARIRDFRAERIARVYGRETPVPLPAGGCLVLHVVPFSAFTDPGGGVDMESYFQGPGLLMPFGTSSFSRIYNLDGVVTAPGAHDRSAFEAYAQLFRTGVAEYAAVLSHCEDGRKYLPMGYERNVVDALQNYLAIAPGLGIGAPVFVFLSFTGVRGYHLGMNSKASWLHGDQARPLSEDTVLLPKAVLEDTDTDPRDTMLPLFRQLANAFGLPRSPTP